MRSEAMKSKMLYDRPLPTQRIVNAIADSKLISLYRNMQSRFFLTFCLIRHFIEAQVNTQQYGRRPYGVGLLVIGYDVNIRFQQRGRIEGCID